MRRVRFVLAGPGRIGISLAAALVRAGHRCVAVEGRAGASRKRAALGLCARSGRPRRPGGFPEFDLLLVAVPDRALPGLARAWVGRSEWGGKVALHTSGALPSRVLAPLGRSGAAVGSLHPLTSLPLPDSAGAAFRGVHFGIEGDPRAVRLARRLARDAGGAPFSIPARAKPMYHLCACLASGYSLALLDAASRATRSAGVPGGSAFRGLLDLARRTLANAAAIGAGRALTGPVPRQDLVTLRAHLRELRSGRGGLDRVYRELARMAVDLASRSGRIPARGARRTIRLLRRA